jgi:hypothetical protein
MNVWEKPSFEELAMNAEIGAYQPEFGDEERSDEPLGQFETAAAVTTTDNRD